MKPTLLLCCLSVCLIGCDSGPTYEEAVQLVINEQKLLEQFEPEALQLTTKMDVEKKRIDDEFAAELGEATKQVEFYTKLVKALSVNGETDVKSKKSLDEWQSALDEVLARKMKRAEEADAIYQPRVEALRKEIDAQKARIARAKALRDRLAP